MLGLFGWRKIAAMPRPEAEMALGPKAEVVDLGFDGLRASLDPAFATPRIREFLSKGAYEAAEIRFAKGLVKDSDRVLELGAGLGVVSSAILKAARPSHYCAVEADPRLIPHIRETHRLNNVAAEDIVNGVFSSDAKEIAVGQVEFVQSKAFWGSSLTLEGDMVADRVMVPVWDANAYVKRAKITTLICDIEGGEQGLLANMNLGGISKIILELHPAHYGKAGIRAVFSRLADAGFAYDASHSAGPVVSFQK